MDLLNVFVGLRKVTFLGSFAVIPYNVWVSQSWFSWNIQNNGRLAGGTLSSLSYCWRYLFKMQQRTGKWIGGGQPLVLRILWQSWPPNAPWSLGCLCESCVCCQNSFRLLVVGIHYHDNIGFSAVSSQREARYVHGDKLLKTRRGKYT